MEETLRQAVERVLRENGLTDRPDQCDGSIHSWRCEYPDRYGPCGCFAELTDDLVGVLAGRPASTEDQP